MVDNVTRETKETALDVANIVVGVAFAVTPWVLGYAAQTAAAWNAWVVGAVIALIAIGALVAFAQWEEWANLVLGVWTFVSPWLLGFTAVTAALYAHLVAGLLVAVLAALELYFARKHPYSTV